MCFDLDYFCLLELWQTVNSIGKGRKEEYRKKKGNGKYKNLHKDNNEATGLNGINIRALKFGYYNNQKISNKVYCWFTPWSSKKLVNIGKVQEECVKTNSTLEARKSIFTLPKVDKKVVKKKILFTIWQATTQWKC